jgi:DNA ligase (NAD+)
MNSQETKKRIEKLKKEINYHRYLYHVEDRQEISADALDSLKHELFELEQKYPQFITPDSPTQRVGGKPLEKFKKIKHIVPQWSFNDAFSEKEMFDFDARIKRELGQKSKDLDYTGELKIDGLHIILTYEKGLLKTGATRGDGKIGEDVTQNLKTIESVPLRINKPINIVVEGEVYMKKSVFEALNKEREKNNLPLFANPRNAAAGAIRQLDPRIVAKRKLDVFIYDLSWPDSEIPSYQSEELEKLFRLGFKVNKNYCHCKDVKEIIDFWKKWQAKREKENFWIDGIVAKVNKRRHQEDLGYTGKAPRWSIAFKWPGEQATTILKDVKFQVGRTGKVTPVAILNPVIVAGTTVTRATLHNADEIKRLNLKIGDTVIIEKAGDVIPRVIKNLPGLRPKDASDIIFPKKCPICDSPVIRPQGEVAHYCSNKNCGAIRRSHLYYFVSKKAFNVDGLGPKIINKLMDEGLITDAPDLFFLKEGDLSPLERFAEKSAENIVKSVQNSKKITLPRILIASGIKYVGEETADLLTEEFSEKIRTIGDFINIFKNLSEEKIKEVEGIGPKVAHSIKNWFSKRENIKFLENLDKAGVEIETPGELKVNESLKGKSFVFTGELELMSRDKAKDKVKERSGKSTNTVSNNTTYLVAGQNPGTKLDKAKKIGIKIITEKQFLGMIK